MRTGILATEDRKAAWLKWQGENNDVSWVQDSRESKNFDLFIDLNFDSHPERLQHYAGNKETLFLLSAVMLTPEFAFYTQGLKYGGEKIFGINAIPTFIERNVLEASNPFALDIAQVETMKLRSSIEWVQSRVGMVTPRIVFMIVNEAFYTLQEGTALAADIDQAMKLGTNYPMGPFEWCNQAGIDNVYRTLDALYTDTREERYKICPLLKTEWLRASNKAQ